MQLPLLQMEKLFLLNDFIEAVESWTTWEVVLPIYPFEPVVMHFVPISSLIFVIFTVFVFVIVIVFADLTRLSLL